MGGHSLGVMTTVDGMDGILVLVVFFFSRTKGKEKYNMQ